MWKAGCCQVLNKQPQTSDEKGEKAVAELRKRQGGEDTVADHIGGGVTI